MEIVGVALERVNLAVISDAREESMSNRAVGRAEIYMGEERPILAAFTLHEGGRPFVVRTGGLGDNRIRAARMHVQIDSRQPSDQKND